MEFEGITVFKKLRQRIEQENRTRIEQEIKNTLLYKRGNK